MVTEKAHLQEVRRRLRSGLFIYKSGYDTTIQMIDEVINSNKIQEETFYTVADMEAAYEYGQDDCGEFGNVKGFGSFIEEYNNKIKPQVK